MALGGSDGGSLTMRDLQYHRPATLRDACLLGARLGDRGAFLAGGTELIPDYQRGRETATELISLGAISQSCAALPSTTDTLRIGGLTTVAQIAGSLRSSVAARAVGSGARAGQRANPESRYHWRQLLPRCLVRRPAACSHRRECLAAYCIA